jgi:hypothetical protein
MARLVVSRTPPHRDSPQARPEEPGSSPNRARITLSKKGRSRTPQANHGYVHTLWSRQSDGRTLLLKLRSLNGPVGGADDGRGAD